MLGLHVRERDAVVRNGLQQLLGPPIFYAGCIFGDDILTAHVVWDFETDPGGQRGPQG